MYLFLTALVLVQVLEYLKNKTFFLNNLNNSLFCIRLNDFCENRLWVMLEIQFSC